MYFNRFIIIDVMIRVENGDRGRGLRCGHDARDNLLSPTRNGLGRCYIDITSR